MLCLAVCGRARRLAWEAETLLPWPNSSVQEPVVEAICPWEAKYLFLQKLYQRSFLCLSRKGAAHKAVEQELGSVAFYFTAVGCYCRGDW